MAAGLDEAGRKRLDSILQQLVGVKDDKPGTEVHLAEDDVTWLARTARALFLRQPMLLELRAPVNVCGDTHGQYRVPGRRYFAARADELLCARSGRHQRSNAAKIISNGFRSRRTGVGPQVPRPPATI